MSAVLTLEGEGGVSVCWRGWYRGGFCGGGLADRQKGPRLCQPGNELDEPGGKKKTRNFTLGRLRWNLKASRTVTEVGGGVRDSGWFGLPPCVCRDKSEGLFSSRNSVLCAAWQDNKVSFVCRLYSGALLEV
jgi:hypothetical protein